VNLGRRGRGVGGAHIATSFQGSGDRANVFSSQCAFLGRAQREF
jgi:hypothetical protein